MHARTLGAAAILLGVACGAAAQNRPLAGPTHADSVRGTNGPARAWWDVAFYDLQVRVQPADSSVSGINRITYRVLQPATELELDLQPPLVLDSVVQDGRQVTTAHRDGAAYYLALRARQRPGDTRTLTAYYHGQPGRARPGAGPFTWSRDSLGGLWFATSDELTGASIWWPLKDWLGDEPDSQRIAITVPDPLVDVSNGRLRSTTHNPDSTTTYEWFVADPINSYDVAINAGRYVHFSDSLDGEGGRLSLDFWPLAYHLDTAKAHWRQATAMLRCFEHWFGPYPWYADSYKLIEAPYLGMEHQSGIAYGNRYLTGYLGRDLSGTGLGLGWDYIVVHESAHEWFGNNITTQDYADLWIHESFATYAEGLYTECQQGRTAGAAYILGLRRAIRNDRPIIGPHGVAGWYNNDMYMKGANVLHTIRQLLDDDAKWRSILRGLNATFRHQTVTGAQIEEYISRESGLDLGKAFAEYLTTTMVPTLEYKVEGAQLSYRWTNVVPGFAMALRVNVPGQGTRWLHPTEAWQTLQVDAARASGFQVDENFYVNVKNVGAAGPAGGGGR